MKKILTLGLALFVFVSICFAQEVNKARVITDKIRYERAQGIKIIITNNFSQENWFGSGFTVPFTTIYIENKTNKGWQEIYPSIPAPTPRPSPSEWIQRNAKKLLPTEKIEIIWNQQIGQYWGGDGKQVNPGKYRVKLEYYTFSLEQTKSWTSYASWNEADKFKRIVYSKEFEITDSAESKKDIIEFRVFQDRKDNFKRVVSIDEIEFPLDKEKACIVAKQACNSPRCDEVTSSDELPKEYRASYEFSLGDFSFVVDLGPICNNLSAFINEEEKTVVCFCAYE